MKALTLDPVWAFAVAHLGKDIENRKWKPPVALWKQDFVIHAGIKSDRTNFNWMVYSAVEAGWHRRWRSNDEVVFTKGGRTERFNFNEPTRGAVVAVVTLEGVGERGEGRGWVVGGPWAIRDHEWWQLGNIRPLDKPIPCKGRQRVWILPWEVEQLL